MLTVELRWFAPGELSDVELRAFADDGRIEGRADEYLLGLDEALGVKRRAGRRLEHKRRRGRTPVEVALGERTLPGVVERWFKRWPEQQEPPPPGRGWIVVKKRRALRDIGGCRAELTVLRIAARPRSYLSAAVEARDADADTLSRAAATLLRAHPELAVRLADARSCGYPAWLAHELGRPA